MSTSTLPVVSAISTFYAWLIRLSSHLQSPLLLVMRLVWGLGLFQIGLGKLMHIEKPTQFFMELGIPFPHENAYLVGCTEMFGGLFLALGLLSRLAALPLTINFIVAYVTSEKEALGELLKLNFDPFTSAAPFCYLLLAVIVLAFGPGAYSIDYAIARWRGLEWNSAKI